MTRSIAAALSAVLVATGAQAAVTGGDTTGGSAKTTFGSVFLIVSPPAQVGLNRQESFNVFAWNEEVAVLGAPLAVNWLTATGMPGTIAAGRRVASHGIVFDPGPGTGPQPEVSGFVTFDRPVIGIITENAELVLSDFLGEPATMFDSTPDRGLEATDFFSLSMDGRTLSFHFRARNPGDNIRVLTLVPEASTWAMMIAGFGLVGLAARRRRTAIA